MFDSVAEALTSDVLESFDRLRGDCGLLAAPDAAVIELSGEDRKGWLQGQATNDVKQLDLGASLSFCLCSPTGQIVAVCDVWGLPGRFLITCPGAQREAVLHRVEQMVVLEDVQARDLTDEVAFLSIQGPNATRALGEFATLPTLDAADSRIGDRPATVLRSNRTGSGGWDVLIPRSDRTTAKDLEGAFLRVHAEAHEIARLEAGIPRLGQDYDARTLPPELGPAFEARHVSYRKGCYTGQEVLMRLHSRGHTNRTWVGLFAEHPLEIGAPVSHPRKKDAGVVTSAAYSPDYGYIGAAMLRNEAVIEGDFVETGGVSAEIRQLPILRFD